MNLSKETFLFNIKLSQD